MKSSPVGELYDKLHLTEQRFRRDSSYPIHKKLNFKQADITDIYHWIIEYEDIPKAGQILDAGCGVGWGVLELAKRTDAHITGISLSELEISQARSNAQHSQLTGNTSFLHQSFDQLPKGCFDLIIAVESLKHSPDLKLSLVSLTNALTDNGRLVIIEDIYSAEQNRPLAEILCRDWQLAKLYSHEDFYRVIAQQAISITELSDFIPAKSTIAIWAKLQLFNLLLKIRPNHQGWQAFRGGYCLDRLYQQGLMRYQALTISKENL